MKGINVLAVMEIDALHAWQSRQGDPDIQREFGEESAEARAAVADLIEAVAPFAALADQLDATKDVEEADDEEWAKFLMVVKDYRKLRAALRRVKGESEWPSSSA
jgi:hypothetical protein